MIDLHLSLNRYAFHWSYPEIVADKEGFFEEQNLHPVWHDATPTRVVNKTSMYTDLLSSGATDVYHAGEWACINRVLKSSNAWMVAKSPPGKGTLNSSFSLFVRRDSAVSVPEDLGGRTVAIEEGTGAQYTAIVDLERYVKREDIKLVQAGEPHRRLMALLDGSVDSASLVGPWSDIARVLGLRMVLQTERTNPTTIVVRRDTDKDLLEGFFTAVNGAIGMIDADPSRFKEDYVARVRDIAAEANIEITGRALAGEVEVSRWERWEAYTRDDFERTYRWMVERGLAEGGRDATGLVGPFPSGAI